MKLLDLITVDCLKVPMAAENKRAAIDELIDLLSALGRVPDAPALKEAVWAREQTRTTGIGHGLAIPHGKCAGMPAIAIAIGKPARPMEFQAIDGRPVRLVVLLASPPDKPSDHIQALAHITRLMMMEEFREQIYAAESKDAMFELIRQQESGS
ncbi:MAG: PTS sugar transporter subunit IIA [Phycisphaerales bacterium]